MRTFTKIFISKFGYLIPAYYATMKSLIANKQSSKFSADINVINTTYDTYQGWSIMENYLQYRL